MLNFDKIGKKVVLGLDFSPQMVKEAMEKNKMLVLDMDFTRKCELHCYYCDRTPDRLDKKLERIELTTEEKKQVISQANELGAWAVGIVGAGEPMLDPDFWELLNFINKKHMIPLVYASGWNIKSKETVEKLQDYNASVMLKYNSEDENVADKMTGVKGYGKHVKQVLKWFLECGFNKSEPPRLGINVVATGIEKNEEAFVELFRWCRSNNIYMHGQSLIPEGNADNENMTIAKQDALNLLNKIAEIDKTEFDISYEVVPPIVGGFRCRKVNVGMFVNIFGEVWDCNGSGRRLGNVRENSLSEIWNEKKSKKIREPLQEGFCLIRERWWSKSQNTK